jgi:ubiquinone biosynthesis UbiH/UbiF/VisC/COQ6 family hydroxylase
MSSEVHNVDVLIAGAGLVGLALAAAVARTGLSVALADRQPVTTPDTGRSGDDWDPRVYAISPGSAAFLRTIGAWQQLSCDRAQAIESMLVRGDAASSLEFSAYDIGERALAWIVEERALRAALVPLVRAAGVPVLAPREFASIAWSPDEARLTFADGSMVTAKLVVAADGLRSWVRDAAGIAATPASYGQTAVVANFACERAHHGRAWQWFRADGGVLAWLPLRGRRISIVWSAPEAQAHDLLALDAAALAARVTTAGDGALGALTLITPPAGFPLSYLALPSTVAHRLALVGDAAHGVHPLAGQGVNLGFGDAAALAMVLQSRGPITDVATPFLLDRYARRRVEPVRAMQWVTDGLSRLFGSPAPWMRTLRNAGLTAVDRIPLAKRLLAHAALG